ncbi:MAG TPA: EthD domain-containing protein [Frankiaceae bacterium]|nr:EthD domain-containing protein [Frankiaceae bacterium]
MIKLVFCCHRNPAMTREQFQDYWLNGHGPLVRSLRRDLPQMLRYVQSHTVSDETNERIRAGRGSGPEYDGITEVWFESLESMGSTAEGAAEAGRKLLEDESKFLDFPRCSVFVTEEHEIF